MASDFPRSKLGGGTQKVCADCGDHNVQAVCVDCWTKTGPSAKDKVYAHYCAVCSATHKKRPETRDHELRSTQGGNAVPGAPNERGAVRVGEPAWEVAGRAGKAVKVKPRDRPTFRGDKNSLWLAPSADTQGAATGAQPPPSMASWAAPCVPPAVVVQAPPLAPTEVAPLPAGESTVAPRAGAKLLRHQSPPAPPAALRGVSVGPARDAGAASGGASAAGGGRKKEAPGEDQGEETGIVFVDDARLDADAWRGRMVGEIVKGGGARLGGCSALRWLRQDAISLRAAAELPRSKKVSGDEDALDFGTVAPGGDGLSSLLEVNERSAAGGGVERAAEPAPPPERIVALQNMSDAPVRVVHLLQIPPAEEGFFSWEILGVHGEGEDVAQARFGAAGECVGLPAWLGPNQFLTMRVKFSPPSHPGDFNQWGVVLVEAARSTPHGNSSPLPIETMAVGLLSSASAMHARDAGALLNAEAPAFVPAFLRTVFDCPSQDLIVLSGRAPERPGGYPPPDELEAPCALCRLPLDDPSNEGEMACMACSGALFAHTLCIQRVARCLFVMCAHCGMAAPMPVGGMAPVGAGLSIDDDPKRFLEVAKQGELTPFTYTPRFLSLLQAEESRIAGDLMNCDMFNASITPGRGFARNKDGRIIANKTPWGDWLVQLIVPGLLEKRPSLHYGDVIRIRFTLPTGRVHNEELLGFVRGIKGTSVQVAIHERGLALISQPAGNLFGTPPSPDMDTKTFLRAQKNMRKRMVLLQHLLEGPQGRLHEEHPRWQEPLGAHVRFVFNRAGFRAMRRVLRTPRVLGNILPAILEAPNQPAAPPQQHPAPPARGPPKPAERVRQAQLQQLFGAAPEEQPAQGASGQEEAAMQSVQVQSGALAKRKRVFDQTLNAEQIESVQRMLDGWEAPSAGWGAMIGAPWEVSAPLLLWGPPGTGKTKCVAEAVVRAVSEGHRVLCCAPSDSAADVVAQRVAARAYAKKPPPPSRAPNPTTPPPEFEPWYSEGKASGEAGGEKAVKMNGWGQPMEVPPEPPQVRVNGWMIRLNTFRRAVETCRADVLPYTWVDSETNCFTVPPPEALSAARVVVTTCAACPLLQRLAVLPGHFSLIIIDEAAQALEPEVLLTLALAGPKTRSMMAGDWRQLGPVVRSPAADSLGLGKSLMERLSHTAQYKKNAALLVKLKHNYRSHPGLLTLPSSLFYQDQLVASANPIVTHSLLPAAGFLAGFGASNSNFSDADGDVEPVATDTPLLFYGVQGRELSEDDTPSFFNRVEAVVVCSLIQLLIKSHLKVSPSQIGVIAPYRKQVQKVRLLLREYDLDSVRVGTVDDYQGQEEKVVLLSTTLSNTERLASDQDSSVGFLNNPRRFNVALTRAKALCIVVGNPLVMLARPHWRALLHHCLRTRSYAGCPPPPECGVEGEELGEDAFLRIMEERLLGAGDEPASGEKVLERSFRDEQEFRVII